MKQAEKLPPKPPDNGEPPNVLQQQGKEEKVVEADAIIRNPSGLHLRPTELLCNEAIKYQSSIRFTHGTTSGNVKSMLSVLAACIKSGTRIHLICEGPDETEALEALTALIGSGLGEKTEAYTGQGASEVQV